MFYDDELSLMKIIVYVKSTRLVRWTNEVGKIE
jgi:hypothetical protein